MDLDHALRALLRAFVLPPMGLVLLAAAGLWIGRRRPPAGRLVVAIALAFMTLLSLPVVATRLSGLVGQSAPGEVLPPGGAQLIVVLGGDMLPQHPPAPVEPGADTLQRLAGGARLARQSGLPVMVSGGTMDARPPQADAMARVLRDSFGVEARFLERRSRDTHENAVECTRILRGAGVSRIALVTSAVHMTRARAEFEALGVQVVPVPVGDRVASGAYLADWLPHASAMETSYDALYEAGGQLVAALRHRL